ncbi:hypothetical protein G4B88_027703 [Cannabis sativa]|uniref:Uncharacterized protein n=1 Tax=Cannabis sativa TaxID=3483 RepID=A0A7J6ERW6_CANSA|nr:hypothetical protein G4B88_027703 [Cannabis sativa]
MISINCATIATLLGCKDVITITADVSKVEDCQRFDINFWGSVYATHFAIPYLKKTKGKIIVISSAATWLPVPRLGLYSATKAAVTSFYETLRVEIEKEVGITIVSPGLTESEMTQGKFLTPRSTLELDQEMRDVEMSMTPMTPAKETAKAIVNRACEGAYYLTVPTYKVLEWSNQLLIMPRPGSTDRDTISKKIVEVLYGFRPCLQPGIVEYPDIGDNGHMSYSHY